MKTDITQVLVDEHRLILRMIDLLEKNARRKVRAGTAKIKTGNRTRIYTEKAD